MRYVTIEKTTNQVINAIVWDGIVPWTAPEGTFFIRSDILNIGDTYISN